ncbi:helix-turn-helix domain-containing protein [Dictyobacter aurantiacus]|nr:helix-turn-helix transcriptional regulator [Dictyobacter aurantiacus]
METSKQKSFAEIVKHQREMRGWSQARMAEELGTTPNRISSWERNVSVPSAYFREKLCSLLDMNAHELGLLSESPPAVPSISISEDQAMALDPSMEVSETVAERSLIGPRPATRKRLFILAPLITLIVVASAAFIAFSSGFISISPSDPYPPRTGHLVLDSTLQQQDPAINWQEGTNASDARCTFKNNTYVAYQPLTGYFHACIAQKTDYTNFAYEVEMTIEQGDFGGIVFRSEDGIDGRFYLFRVHTDGSYWLYRFADNSIAHATLLDQGTCKTFNQGLNQPNLIAVVAQNDVLTLYVNQREISSVHDGGYTHGQIGLLAGSMTMGPAEAAFKNVRVWTL